jgi:CMP/dCMP kinase
MKKLVIAIDGPAGAGKSTISKIIAKKLNIEYIDTGAMYRAVTLKILTNNINFHNENELQAMLKETTVCFEDGRIILDGFNVSEEIRMPIISERVSEIAAIFVVREKLVELQRQMGLNKSVIMDGRDIGTYVLTNANYKIFLTASVQERAERRYEELINKGIEVLYEDVYIDIEERDQKDSTRELNPLRRAEDAILVDTSGKNIDEVVEVILKIIHKSLGNGTK